MTEKKKGKNESPKPSASPPKTRPTKSARTSGTQKLEKQVKELESALGEIQDRHLRLRAEFDNYRKRKEREIGRLLEYEGEEVVRSFLPVVDDLERMIELANRNDSGSPTSLIEGLNLTLGNVKKRLKALEVQPFESVGKVFDPDLHDAMLVRESDKHGENEVIEEYEKGYRFKDKIIRHAKVVVNGSEKG